MMRWVMPLYCQLACNLVALLLSCHISVILCERVLCVSYSWLAVYGDIGSKLALAPIPPEHNVVMSISTTGVIWAVRVRPGGPLLPQTVNFPDRP